VITALSVNEQARVFFTTQTTIFLIFVIAPGNCKSCPGWVLLPDHVIGSYACSPAAASDVRQAIAIDGSNLVKLFVSAQANA